MGGVDILLLDLEQFGARTHLLDDFNDFRRLLIFGETLKLEGAGRGCAVAAAGKEEKAIRKISAGFRSFGDFT